MSDHESNRNDAAAVTQPPGTEPNADPALARAPRRLPKIDLASIKLPKFGRKKAEPAQGEAGSEGYPVAPEPGAPRRRLPKISWDKMPLANARRETRVGVAALASFLILVAALVINRGTKKPEKTDTASASGSLLALNTTENDKNENNAKNNEVKNNDDAKDGKEAGKDKPAEPEPKPDPAPLAKASFERPSTRRTDRSETPPSAPPAEPKPAEPKPGDPPRLPSPSPTPADALPSMDIPPVAADLPSVIPPSPTPAPAATKPGADKPPAEPPVVPPSDLLPTPVATTPSDPLPAMPAAAPPLDPLAPREPTPTPGPSPLDAANDKPPGPPATDATKDKPPGPATNPPATAPPASAPPPPNPFPDPAPTTPAPAIDPFPAPAPTATPEGPKPTTSSPLPDPTPVEPRPANTPAPVRPDPVVSAPTSTPGPTPASQVPAFTKPPIESEPAPSRSSSPAADAAPALPAGARLVHSLGKRRMPDPEPEARLAPEPTVADAPLPREDLGARDREDPILHTVESGENFWTISRTYYGSGRYYKALHAANRRLVPRVDELYVGTTIKVPPVESLDPTQIEPPGRGSDSATTPQGRSATTTRARNADDGRPVPTRTRGEVSRGLPASRGRGIDEPSRPSYRVRTHDTLRSIARDTLGDPHRYREILDLNRDAIDDPNRLAAGTTLTLPEDATVRDR